jgi:hypothetical protein
MVHVLEHAQLPVCSLGVDGALEGPGQLLDGHLVCHVLVQEGVVGAAHLESILQNFVSAENFSDQFSSSDFEQIFTQTQLIFILL